MQKLRLICLAALSFSITWAAHAEDKRYISDELSTYVHSGPGNQYRIVGTLNAGEEVTLLSVNDSTNYGQIRDPKGRTTWIPLDQLSQTPSLRTRVPELEQQVKTLTDKLANIDNTWNQRTSEMQEKVAGSDSTISSLQKENQDLKTSWWSRRRRSTPLTCSSTTSSAPLSCSGSCTAAASPASVCCWVCCCRT